ncbi:RAI1 like PD-XK nuclease-domain-containing protein [Polychytrium aggregatum]|uniref:RAI1 like PD-XK nuclease-domain-containing protein n=1 Tax=Polychytrium aggregatum TaxID=110093 RepID=UPI0022FEE56D|nr:RAI1 like PD-XK nuclease-domain-containing protein [Polychytrium aggregatum]KAI9202292.1 RAI1 like PD-XK nuclease-domain-containing protein [Polychytrium aggregatum]
MLPNKSRRVHDGPDSPSQSQRSAPSDRDNEPDYRSSNRAGAAPPDRNSHHPNGRPDSGFGSRSEYRQGHRFNSRPGSHPSNRFDGRQGTPSNNRFDSRSETRSSPAFTTHPGQLDGPPEGDCSPRIVFPVPTKSDLRRPNSGLPVAQYKQPMEIGFFSFDHQRQIHFFSDQILKWYRPPALDQSLLAGYPDLYAPREDIDEHLDGLVTFMQALNQKQTEKSLEPFTPNFCTWRGLMTKIMCTPYANEPWELGLTLFEGTIYIEEHKFPSKYSNMSPEEDRRMTYMGYKFESISTADVPPSELDPSSDSTEPKLINTNEQFCSVCKTKLGDLSLIIGGEVDCQTEGARDPANPSANYIELKTNKVFKHERQQFNFEKFKLLRIWAQSFLLGIPKVVLGFRTEEGILSHLETMNTLEIPRKVREKHLWDPNVCLGFSYALLRWVRSHVVRDDPRGAYTLRFSPSMGQVELLPFDTKFEFLPSSFYAR